MKTLSGSLRLKLLFAWLSFLVLVLPAALLISVGIPEQIVLPGVLGVVPLAYLIFALVCAAKSVDAHQDSTESTLAKRVTVAHPGSFFSSYADSLRQLESLRETLAFTTQVSRGMISPFWRDFEALQAIMSGSASESRAVRENAGRLLNTVVASSSKLETLLRATSMPGAALMGTGLAQLHQHVAVAAGTWQGLEHSARALTSPLFKLGVLSSIVVSRSQEDHFLEDSTAETAPLDDIWHRLEAQTRTSSAQRARRLVDLQRGVLGSGSAFTPSRMPTGLGQLMRASRTA